MRSASRTTRRAALLLLLLGLPLLLAVDRDAPAPPTGFPPGPYWATDEEELIQEYIFRDHDAGNLVLHLSNHGFIGNNFSDRTASMEYPKGSEVDHLIRAGIWVGGVDTNLDTLVTTGVQDSWWGTYSVSTEWVPVAIPASEQHLGSIRERSTLPTSPYYDPQNAVSEQDLVTAMLDTLDREHVPVTGNIDTWHSASGLLVDQVSYAWSFEPADAMVILNYTLVPTRRISQVYIGLYAELTTGYKGQYPDWRPPGASWFYKQKLAWADDLPEYAALSEDPLNLVVGWHYTYDNGQAPQHSGIKFLGAKYKHFGEEWNTDAGVAWRWWEWEPGSLQRHNDFEKYKVLTETGIDDWTAIHPSPDSSGDSPIQLISVGPWELFPASAEPGDTLIVSFAMLGGDNFLDLVENALFAQEAYANDFALPSPPHSPRVKMSSDSGSIRLMWEDSPERAYDSKSGFDFEGYRIHVSRSAEEADFSLLRQYDRQRIPARLPESTELAYFSDETLASLLEQHPEYGDEQSLLDGLWPEGDYLYDAGADYPLLVTEPDTVGYDTGFGEVLLPESEWIHEAEGEDTLVYKYAYALENVSDGHHYYVSVTSFDQGTSELASLESGIGQNVLTVIPGPSDWEEGRPVSVFPNPYRGSAVWDLTRATGRFIWFVGLPQRAKIKIFTLAGDLVDEIDFDGDSYAGANALGVNDGSGEPPVLPGTLAAWDLRSQSGQPVSTGLYLFSVTDEDSGESQQGKFLVLK